MFVRLMQRMAFPLFAACFVLGSSELMASPSLFQGFTYQGRFLSLDGSEPMKDVVDLVIGIYSPDGACLLYEQRNVDIDLSLSSGLFTLHVGSELGDPKRIAGRDPGKTLAQIFSNAGEVRAAGLNCAAGYTSLPGDPRKLRVTVYPHGGAAETMSPDLTISPAPQAMVADTLQGLDPTKFVQLTGATSALTLSKNALDSIFGIGGVVDASSLHHHDSLYARLGIDGALSVGSGNYLDLGVRSGNPNTAGWSTDPTKIGRTWLDSSSGEIRYWDGSAIKSLGTSGAGVTSFNSRAGAVSLSSADVTDALGFTPQNAASLGADAKAVLAETANNPVKYSLAGGSFYLQAGSADGDTLRWNGTKWEVGADLRHWSTDGTHVYRTGGNVGIRSANPTYSLEVAPGATDGVIAGRAFIGGWAGGTAEGIFSHQSYSGGLTEVAVRQNNSGRTILNSKEGQYLGFSIGAVEKMRIDSTGHVGIGTPSPVSPLHVTTAGANPWAPTNKPVLLVESAGTSNSYFAFGVKTNAADALTITNAGNVGIGTISPGATLEVSSAAPQMKITYSANAAYNTRFYQGTDGLQVVGGGATGAPFMASDGSARAVTLIPGDTASGSAVKAKYGYLKLLSDGGSGIYIDSATSGGTSGNVGIGTNNPLARLEVAGAVRFGGTASACDANSEGQQRYSPTTKQMEFCNGTEWVQYTYQVTGTTLPVSAIGPPVDANAYPVVSAIANYVPSPGAIANTWDNVWPVVGVNAVGNDSCVSLPGDSTNQIVYDLGSEKIVGKVYASGTNDVTYLRVAVSFSTDNVTFSSGVLFDIVGGDVSTVQYRSVTLGTPVTARYVRLMNGSTTLNSGRNIVCEIAVGP